MFRRHLYCSISYLVKNFNYKHMAANDSNSLNLLSNRVLQIERTISSLSTELADIKKMLIERKFSSTSITQKRKTEEVDAEEVDAEEVKKQKYNFTVDKNGYVECYTDGACENNGRANAKAGLGVWFGHDHPLNISEPAKGRATNNVGEIQACTRAIEEALRAGADKIKIHTDSEFVIKSMTEWMVGWKMRNWVTKAGTPVKNKDDFIALDRACKRMTDVQFKHVRGHQGNVGNEAADKLAKEGASRYRAGH